MAYVCSDMATDWKSSPIMAYVCSDMATDWKSSPIMVYVCSDMATDWKSSPIIACLSSAVPANSRGVSPSASCKWISPPCSVKTKHTAREPLEGVERCRVCGCVCGCVSVDPYQYLYLKQDDCRKSQYISVYHSTFQYTTVYFSIPHYTMYL